MKNKVYKLKASNRVTYENLSNVDDLVFENVYKEADLTLAKIMRDEVDNMGVEEQYRDVSKDSQSLNVISFLGGRGRGKTSAMLSFLSSLKKLRKYEKWSETGREYPNAQYLILPYIDAAMLAEQEFVFDVILAEMWDAFEEKLKNNPQNYRDSSYSKDLERRIKVKFEEVRRAYKVSQEREKKEDTYEELPTAGVLHELAVSINLRQQMTKLVEDYLLFFSLQDEDYIEMGYAKRRETYLIIAIDDIDMSGKKSYFILEQIRRFLRIPKVIIMLTADIDQLQKTCALRYADIYEEIRERQRAVSEYLEKVMPYNMRIYLPELKENHSKILIETGAGEKLRIYSKNEKDFILEVMAKKCDLYFDGTRKKRHFLQNQTMRSMVNYFEQLIRVDGVKNYTSWLKADIKERLIERIADKEQKAFMEDLLTKDYEDMNSILLGYIKKKLKDYTIGVHDTSLGEVLYACNLLESENAENIEFVNCVIMLYSVIMMIDDTELKEKIWGNSIFGEWEYGVVQRPADELCQGFSNKAKMVFEYDDSLLNNVQKKDIKAAMQLVIGNNIVNLKAWVDMLLFVTIITGVDDRIEYDVHTEEIQDAGDSGRRSYNITIIPKVSAKKKFLSCGYMKKNNVYARRMLRGCIEEFGKELFWNLYHEFDMLDDIKYEAESLTKDIFEQMNLSEVVNEANNLFQNNFKLQAIEFIYSIGKSLNEITLPETNEEDDCYETLVLKYKAIYGKLKEIDEYYAENIKLETHFAKEFRNSYQAKLLFEDFRFDDYNTQLRFRNKLGELLLEAKRVAIFTPPSR